MRRSRPDRPLRRLVCLLACLGGGSAAWAQTAAPAAAAATTPGAAAGPSLGAGTWSLSYTASMAQTLTDNVSLDSASPRAEAITQLSAGMRMSGRSGRTSASFDYSLSGFIYARGTSSATHQHALSASASTELIDNFAFVDARAGVSQQSISAFGVQSTDPGLINANRTQVASYSVSPYVRGQIGGLASYEARLNHSESRSSGTHLGDTSADLASVSIASLARGSIFSWNAGASRSISDASAGRRTRTDQVNVGVGVAPMPEVRLRANAGRETTDVQGGASRSGDTWSVGIDVQPEPRTSFGATYGRRFFGDTYSVVASHRMPRSMWTLSSSRDLSLPGLDTASGLSRSAAFELLFAQLAAVEPDPFRREALVNAILNAGGIGTTVPGGAGFLSSAATVSTRHQLSVALQGVRDTLTFTLNSSTSRRADGLALRGDDLDNASVVRSTGASAVLSHQLTPQSGLSLAASVQRASGSASSQGSRTTSLSLVYSARLGPHTNASLSLRRVEFDAALRPYTENAAIARVDFRF